MRDCYSWNVSAGWTAYIGQTTFEYFPETQPTCSPTTTAFQPLAAVATKSKVEPGLMVVIILKSVLLPQRMFTLPPFSAKICTMEPAGSLLRNRSDCGLVSDQFGVRRSVVNAGCFQIVYLLEELHSLFSIRAKVAVNTVGADVKAQLDEFLLKLADIRSGTAFFKYPASEC